MNFTKGTNFLDKGWAAACILGNCFFMGEMGIVILLFITEQLGMEDGSGEA